MRVTGLISQGAKRFGSPEYIKSYKVAYSDDGKTWRTYKVKSKDEDMVRHSEAHKEHRHAHPLASLHPSPHKAKYMATHTHMHTQHVRLRTMSRTGWRM